VDLQIVKLDKRYTQFKTYGHTAAFKFSGWCRESHLAEYVLFDLYGHGRSPRGQWYGYFAKSKKEMYEIPYIITFRDSSIISIVLLKMSDLKLKNPLFDNF
jgi:hypothetical protein